MKRIWVPWWLWECYPAGFYATECKLSPDEAERRYAEFLADTPRFERGLERVLDEWPNSCQHFLSNSGMNRIAWLGQAAMCIETGIPSRFRSGFRLLSAEQQLTANRTAEKFLKRWRRRHETSTQEMPGLRSTVEAPRVPR